jgi:hypothetical protein
MPIMRGHVTNIWFQENRSNHAHFPICFGSSTLACHISNMMSIQLFRQAKKTVFKTFMVHDMLLLSPDRIQCYSYM